MSQRSESDLTRVAHARRSGPKHRVDGDSPTPFASDRVTAIMKAAPDRPKGKSSMRGSRFVLAVATGLCLLGMSSPLIATCIDDSECDDGVRCTLDQCSSGICVHFPVDAACTDPLYCNGDETCDVVLDCLPGTNPCLPLSCAEATDECWCASDDDCDDGSFCTGVETCVDLQCVSGAAPNCDDGLSCTIDTCDDVAGECVNAVDHGACDDGLFCSGVEVCAPATGDPETGCEVGMSPCDDGDGCTVDVCDEVAETCTSTPDCSDGVGCTDDSCNVQTNQCDHAANDSVCADGDFCNGDEFCDPVDDCQPAPHYRSCDDGLACTFEMCDPGLNACDYLMMCWGGSECTVAECTTAGCVYTPDESVCDDGLFCSGVETCDVNDGCQTGTDPCDDGIACTVDACDEIQGCTHTPNDAACDDAKSCTQDVCNVLAGCLNTPDHISCDNGLSCDGSEICHPLSGDPVTGCAPGAPLCVDTIACTVDSCEEPGNCLYAPDDTACDDGITCTLDWCDVALGCQATPDDLVCDDGLFCDGAEVCAPATGDPTTGCVAGPPPCVDTNGCTIDTCDVLGDVCTFTVDCDDQVDCTDDSCNEQTNECEHAANDSVCDDDVFCNGDESCDPVAGCQPGPGYRSCDDGLACTFELCDPVLDICDYALDCFGGSVCTSAECTTSGCVYTPIDANCIDAFSCTLDLCDAATGCDHFPVDVACDDGLFCNGPEACDPSLGCVPGGDPCVGQVCDEVTNACDGCLDDTGCSGFTPNCCNGHCQGCCDDSDCFGAATCRRGVCVLDPEAQK